MRILVCGINYAPDLIGVAKYNTELCEGLAALGHDVRVITAPPYYPHWRIPDEYRSRRYRRETLNGVAITRAPIYVPEQPSGAKRLLHHASFLASSSWPLLSTTARWRPEVVLAVAPSLLSASAAAMAARMFGARSWLHVQDLEVDAAFELGLLENKTLRSMMLGAERMILGAFDRVSTISPQMMRRLEKKGLRPDRLRELRNWVDTSVVVPGNQQTAFRSSLGLRPTDTVALYSGAISNKQGLELVLEAAAATKDDQPDIHYVLCGNGPQKSRLVREAHGLGNVHFIDLQPAERLSELLSTANIHLLPQQARAADLVLPSKLSGMLASGRPIIAMAESGTGIANEVAGAGMVIPPGDARALADSVTALAGNGALCEQFGTAARLLAQRRWDRLAIVKSFEREFALLLQSVEPSRKNAATGPAGVPPSSSGAIAAAAFTFAPHGKRENDAG
jgi:colanic acid biosynthesis glycosyl transferase WcaI